MIDRSGVRGDEQGDTRHHGGPDKSVHHYPYDHYHRWLGELPECAEILSQPGAFGENISASGLTEEDVCIGDIWQLGGALVQVSQGRQPCWKLNVRFRHPRMAHNVQATLRTGWYYRVLEAGTVGAGDQLRLLARPHATWSVKRLMGIFYRDPMNLDALREISELAGLSTSWRKLAGNRLANRKVEGWQGRLGG
jgi:MOSC domain-containing protein YiiM